MRVQVQLENAPRWLASAAWDGSSWVNDKAIDGLAALRLTARKASVLATKAEETQGKGAVLATKTVETQGKRRVAPPKGSGFCPLQFSS